MQVGQHGTTGMIVLVLVVEVIGLDTGTVATPHGIILVVLKIVRTVYQKNGRDVTHIPVNVSYSTRN